VNCGRSDFEVALEVSLCRWTTIHFRVRVEESKILTLQVRELGHHFVTSRRPTPQKVSGGTARQGGVRPLDRRSWALRLQKDIVVIER
jgi:hypothetical protein